MVWFVPPYVSTICSMLWLFEDASDTFLEISKANFRPIPAVVPPPAVMSVFDNLARPMYLKVVECERESRTLAALRDTLLPKLISGEMRVSDAERFVKEARE